MGPFTSIEASIKVETKRPYWVCRNRNSTISKSKYNVQIWLDSSSYASATQLHTFEFDDFNFVEIFIDELRSRRVSPRVLVRITQFTQTYRRVFEPDLLSIDTLPFTNYPIIPVLKMKKDPLSRGKKTKKTWRWRKTPFRGKEKDPLSR